MAQGRVQAPDLQANIRLQPAPMQSDTYAPPPQPAKNENLFRLADALGAFSNSAGNLIGLTGKSSKEQRAKDDAAFQMHIAGQTLAQTRKDIAEGRMMVTDDKIANAARQSVYGGKWAESLAADTDAELQTNFDWDKGNPEEFLAKTFQENIEKSGLTDPNALAAAGKAWDGYKSAVLAKQQKYRNDRTVQSTVDTAFTVISDKANQWISAGMDPAKFASNLNAMRGELGVKGSLGANEETLDNEYLNAASRIATTNPEYAVAMLDAEYTGRSGKTSLSSQRAYRDKVLQIKAEAAKAVGVRYDKSQTDDIDHQADTLLAEGKLDRVTDTTWFDHNHEQKTVPAETIKKEALNRYLGRSQEIAQTSKETPEQTMARELRVSQQSGLDHPGLKSVVSGIAKAASVDMTQNPDAMGLVMDKVKMARWLYNTSKNTYMSYLDEPDRDFMESFMVAKDDLTGKDGRQMSDQAALEFAVRTSQPVQVDGLNFTREQNDKIDRSVKTITSQGGIMSWFSNLTPWNSAAAQQRVSSIAKRLVRGGVDQDKAVTVAIDSVKRNSITYNGTLLEMNSKALPDNYQAALDGIIGDFVTENPGVLTDHDISKSDITIMPIQDLNRSGGRFMLTDKNTGQPLMDDKKGEPFFVSLATIRQRGNNMQATADAQAAHDISVHGAAKLHGLVRAKADDGNGHVWVNPKTRETFDVTVPEAGGKPVIKKLGKRVRKDGPVYDDNGFMPPQSPRASN
ncbi:hypothetical protein FJ420_01955 [Mesorhizobium sp. B3-1-3]|uniref:hypothetical protein n=1 Tax=unclassified Mesorhizobium TaxID=325217 RepID=UPI00112B8C60|nr:MULTISPECIES: hypothetical protein [unclassified Mesorhizobium]TPI67599.1 hypothetical protein FJ424_09925 [Mesorhizobium sp. B3-1-8]TPI75645.1 hypothetical protein FJ420_01955 [Mesorhizobium sp. B3-1-3]